MADFSIFAAIIALDKASKVFGKVGDAAKKSGTGIKTAFKGAAETYAKMIKGAQKVGNSLEKIGHAAQGAQSVMAGFQQVADLARLGATAERVEDRFEKFAGTIGDAESILESFQAGVGGTASKMDAMAQASGLIQAGLVGSGAEMEKVTEVASRLGNQTIGVTDRIGEFSQLLKNQSIQLLDNFGISSGKVRERIKELQAETKGLSREQAFLTATFEEADKALAILGPRADDALTEFESLDAQMADLKVEIGQGLVPAMSALLGIAISLLDAIKPLVTVFGEVSAGAERMETSIDDANAAATSMGEEMSTLVAAGADISETMEMMGNRLDDAAQEWDNMSNIQKFAVNVMGKANDGAHVLGLAIVSLNKELAGGTSSYEDYISEVDKFNAGVTEAESKITALTQAQFKWQKSWDAGLTQDQTAQLSQLNDTVAAVTEEYGEYTHANLQAFLATQRLKEATQEIVVAEDARTLSARDELFALEDLTSAETSNLQTRIKASEKIFEAANAHDAAAKAAEHSAQMAERGAAQQALQAQRASEQATALREAAAAADEFARSQANLAVQLSGATEEQFKQAVFAEVDAADIGLEAYTQLGQSLGILDEKAADLAAAVPMLTQAYADGIIPTENMAAATEALFESAGNADFSVGALLDQYAIAPGLIGPSREAQESLNERLIETGEVAPDAAGGVEDFSTSVSDAAGPVQGLTGDVELLAAAMASIPDITLPSVSGASGGATGPTSNGGLPSLQGGGIIPGPVGQPVLMIGHGGEVVTDPRASISGPSSTKRGGSRGGDTIIINDESAMNRWQAERQREDQLARHSANM